MSNTATVAVLFCDVVGSTERLTRLGDEAGDDFRRRFFSDLRNCVTSNGGIEVKNLGDGLMVVFERSAIDAIRCAAEMHDTAERFDPVDPVVLRVGISVGEVAHEDQDWFGTPVVEAARLCGVAGSAQTLAPALLEHLVGSRGRTHRFRPLGPMTLKGLAAPMSVVEVDGPEVSAAPEPAVADQGDGDDVVVSERSRVDRGRRTRLVVASIAALVVLALVGGLILTSGGDDETAATSATTTQVAKDAVTRPQGYEPRFEPSDCPPATASAAPEATCGNLVVPESRQNPGGRTISVPVAKLNGPPGGTADPVVILDVNEPVATTSLKAAADVYSLGLRGFGGAGDTPLTCPEVQSAWTGTLAVRADDTQAMAKRVESTDACAARLRAAGVQLEGYTMSEAADDIRDLTVALDLDRVSVAAGGYTTTAAVAWARSNPGSVASLLLTNPTPPGESVLEDPARAAARSFEKIVELCFDDASCRSAYPDLETQFMRRFDDLQAEPRLVSTKSISGLGQFAVMLDGRRYAAGLETAMRESARLGLVPSAVQGASDELTAAAGIDEDVNFYVGPSLTAAFLSVTCSYDARLNRTAEISDATMQQFAGANEPTFGRICQSWGVPSEFERLSRPLDLDVPVLLASGGVSVSGVNKWAESMAEGLDKATVVHLPTMSEDLVFAPPPCLRQLREQFVADPDGQLDPKECDGKSPSIEFVSPS